MAKLTLIQFSKWLQVPAESIIVAKKAVDIYGPNKAYTHLKDAEESEASRTVEAIWFEYGSWKEAIARCKKELGIIEEIRRMVRDMLLNQ